MFLPKCLIATALLLSLTPMPAKAIEEPAYRVVRSIGAIEIREYAPYVVAQVVIEGDVTSAGNRAFPILAGYIFGKNRGERKLAMTAPVTQSAAPVKLAMTAPVTQTAAGAGRGQLVQFVLPRSVSLASAPEPLDPRVKLAEMPAQRRAVIQFSGFWSEGNYQEHLTQLRQALQEAQLAPTGEPVYARYNAPFTPWFLRRNEIWLPLP